MLQRKYFLYSYISEPLHFLHFRAILKWLWKEFKDCIQNERESGSGKAWRHCGFTLLTLPRFPRLLYYLEKMSQILGSLASSSMHTQRNFYIESLRKQMQTRWKLYSSSGIQGDITTTENWAEKVSELDYETEDSLLVSCMRFASEMQGKCSKPGAGLSGN